MNKKPKMTQIRRLFEMNKIADYSKTKTAKVIHTEPCSMKKKQEIVQKSVNFNLDELERYR